VVTAAFIGPGTVTTCTLAGVGFDTTLLWVLTFAVLATMVLQEMSARLALASGAGLAESLSRFAPPWGRLTAWVSSIAVLLGVLAFEAGNLSGAGLGLAAVTDAGAKPWTATIAIVAAGLLLSGHYRVIERVLMACVGLMGIVFVITAAATAPDWGRILRHLIVPSLPDGSGLTALALVGTTLVPYNLYLHAGAVRERWRGREHLADARRDLVAAVALGGLISTAIVVTAAAALAGAHVMSASDMARQLEPLLGAWAQRLFGIGFATAGLTSAITAPMAAAYIVAGLTRGGDRLGSPLIRAVMLATIAIGATFALVDIRPVRLILLAQAANGIILPVIALALLAALNDRRRLGALRNRWRANLAGAVIVALTAILAARTFLG
jgi:Mn2+/Fe2+ NRAMP family transporter